jgi:hypothetical protein
MKNGNFDRDITNMVIEILIKNLSTKKSPGPDVLTGEHYQTSIRILMLFFSKSSQK